MPHVRKFEKPFFTVLDLILLAVIHVALNAIDAIGYQQTDQLIQQTQQQVFEVGGLDNIQIEQFVSFTQGPRASLTN